MATRMGPRRSGRAQLRIGVLVESRYLGQAQPRGAARALRDQGHQVVMLDPASAVVDLADGAWCDQLDLVVCRGRSPAVLALLAVAEAHGVRCVNSSDAISGVVNKARSGAALAAAGVPVPASFLGSPRELADTVSARPPLILKPICGDNASGLRVVWSRGEWLTIDWPGEVALAQHFLTTDGTDLKLYCAGERVWAVRRPSPLGRVLPHGGATCCHQPSHLASSDTTPPGGIPLPVTAELSELAHCCQKVTGLDLFGVDCVLQPDGPVVIEVNDFPNYIGVEDADRNLAEHLLAQARL
jgi:ribosomal protein S6--L-glutamate ligase